MDRLRSVAANLAAFVSATVPLDPAAVRIDRQSSAGQIHIVVVTPPRNAPFGALAQALTPLASAPASEASSLLGLPVQYISAPDISRILTLAPPTAPPWPPLVPMDLNLTAGASSLSGPKALDVGGMGGLLGAMGAVVAILVAIALYCLWRRRRHAESKGTLPVRRTSTDTGTPFFPSMAGGMSLSRAPDYSADIELQQPGCSTPFQGASATLRAVPISTPHPVVCVHAPLEGGAEHVGEISPSHQPLGDDEQQPTVLPGVDAVATTTLSAIGRAEGGRRRSSSTSALWAILMQFPASTSSSRSGVASKARAAHPTSSSESTTCSVGAMAAAPTAVPATSVAPYTEQYKDLGVMEHTVMEHTAIATPMVVHADPFPVTAGARESSGQATASYSSTVDEPPGYLDPFPSRSFPPTSAAAAAGAAAKSESTNGTHVLTSPSDYRLEKQSKEGGGGGDGAGSDGSGGGGGGAGSSSSHAAISRDGQWDGQLELQEPAKEGTSVLHI